MIKRHKFDEKITDDEYDAVIQQLKGETSLTFGECILRLRKRKQELESSAGKATKAKVCRNKNGDGKAKPPSTQVPEIPGYIVYKIEPTNLRRDLLKWQFVWNKEGRHIAADGCNLIPNKKKQERNADSDHDSSAGTSNQKRNAQQGNSTKTGKARRTTIVESGTKDGGVDVLFKDRNEHEDKSESDDGEKASPPNTTRIKPKNKYKGKYHPNNKYKGKNPTEQPNPKKNKGKVTRF